MNSDHIKTLLDTCFTAKRITETMKALPEGIKPRHIHVIECIFTLSRNKDEVRVSDVSGKLGITTPSVTKLISELEAKKAVEKYSLGDDGRVTLLRLTELGLLYQERYVMKYHAAWAKNMSDVTDEQVKTAVQVIERLKLAMPGGNDDES